MGRQIPWARIIAEGVAIVVSILLAFGIQAWWEGRGEAQRRQALLDGLSSDFASAAEDLNRVIQMHVAGRDAAVRLVQKARSGTVSSNDIPEVDSLLSVLFNIPTWDPPMGTLQALVSSGDLDILDNVDLARALTAWPAHVSDLVEDQERNYVLVREHFTPFLQSRGVDTNDLIWNLPPDRRPWEAASTEAYRLLEDPAFQGILGDRMWVHRD